jgi:hypothetical protein
VKLAAGVTLAGSALGIMGTGVAEAAVGPPLNVTAVEVPTADGPTLNIDWDAPTAGDPVTYYEVLIDAGNNGSIDASLLTPSIQTSFSGFAAAPGTTYSIRVEANDENTFNVSAPFVITTASAPPIGCPTSPWAPFCTVDDFIKQQYLDWNDRMPTLDELNFWREFLQPRDESPFYPPGVVEGPLDPTRATQNQFLDQFRREIDVKAGPVIRLYIAYFLRNPEFDGYNFWLDAITEGGWTMGQVSDFFSQSQEFQNRYGSLDDAEFVSLVYQNVMGRNPDAPGFAFWTRQLENGRSRGWMMMQFTEAPSFEFQNKTRIAVAVTEVYNEMLNRLPTLAEYNMWTFALQSNGFGGITDYPLLPFEVNPVYIHILNSNEYRARITARF